MRGGNDGTPVHAPHNHAVAWLRVTLWILPTGVAWMSGIATGWWSNLPTKVGSIPMFTAWAICNLLFTVAVGYYCQMLSPSPRKKPYRVILFLTTQVFVIPLLSSVVILAVWAWHPMNQ